MRQHLIASDGTTKIPTEVSPWPSRMQAKTSQGMHSLDATPWIYITKLAFQCDETRPVCSNCSKRHTECEFDSSSSLLWANKEPRNAKSTNSGNEGPLLPELLHGTANPFVFSADDDETAHSRPSLNLGDLELMMQWCNSTYQVLTRNERTDPIWRLHVPEEALSHPFLMHRILALSALHIADEG